MGKVKLKTNGEEKSEFGVAKKVNRGHKVRQKWNHIFKKIYVGNGHKMNRSNGDVVVDESDYESENENQHVEKTEEMKVKKVEIVPVREEVAPVESEIKETDNSRTTKINGKKIITDPIPSTSTGITANGRGKRKWEGIPYHNGMIKRKFYGMNGLRMRQSYDDSSLDEDSSDYEHMMNGEFDLSSDIHYEGSSNEESEEENDMADLMAMHEMHRNGMDESDYDEEYCSEEESLDEEYSENDETSNYDSDEIESQYFSDTEEEFYDSSEDEEEDETENYHLYEGTSSDTDYDPGDDFIEDLFVARGTAVTYSAKELTNYLPFSEDTDEPQVIDVTDLIKVTDTDSNDSCPKLVPINGQTLSDKESTETSGE